MLFLYRLGDGFVFFVGSGLMVVREWRVRYCGGGCEGASIPRFTPTEPVAAEISSVQRGRNGLNRPVDQSMCEIRVIKIHSGLRDESLVGTSQTVTLDELHRSPYDPWFRLHLGCQKTWTMLWALKSLNSISTLINFWPFCLKNWSGLYRHTFLLQFLNWSFRCCRSAVGTKFSSILKACRSSILESGRSE